MSTTNGIVHIRPERPAQLSFGQDVIPDREVERVQGAMAQAHNEGYEIADVPDDGRDHPYWGARGSATKPCPLCTSCAAGLVALVDEEGDRTPVLAWAHSIAEAEAWIQAHPDTAKVDRGGFGIDAPEWMLP